MVPVAALQMDILNRDRWSRLYKVGYESKYQENRTHAGDEVPETAKEVAHGTSCGSEKRPPQKAETDKMVENRWGNSLTAAPADYCSVRYAHYNNAPGTARQACNIASAGAKLF